MYLKIGWTRIKTSEIIGYSPNETNDGCFEIEIITANRIFSIEVQSKKEMESYIDKLDLIFDVAKEQEAGNCDCPACQLRRAMQSKQTTVPGDVPTEVREIAEMLGEMFGGSVEIHRGERPRTNPRNKRRQRNKRKGGQNETR